MRIKLCVLILLPLCMACAKVGMPTGGAKDTTAPTVLQVIPDSGSVHFNSKLIEVEFDEYVQLNNIQQQFFASPAFKVMPGFRLKKKSLLIEIKDSLKPNTTYSLNFGKAIGDVNENNILEDFNYVFSTGSFIDSASIKGQIVDALSGSTPKDFTVFLWTLGIDSAAYYTRKPDYLARVRPDGSFQCNYLAKGPYKVMAVQDKNKDFLWQFTEALGFLSEPVWADIDSNSAGLKLISFNQEVDSTTVVSQKLERGELLLIGLNRSCKSCLLKIKEFAIEKQWKGPGKDSIYAYIPQAIEFDSLSVEVYDADKAVDSLKIYPIKTKSKVEDGFKFKIPDMGTLDAGKRPQLKAPLPLDPAVFQKSLSLMKKDSSRVDCALLPDSSDPYALQLDIFAEFGEQYRLLLPDSFCSDISGLFNKADTLNFAVYREEEYGSIAFKVNYPFAESGIYQCLDASGKTVYQASLQKGETRLSLPLLRPGKFVVRVIVDSDGNGQFTSGSLIKGRQAERVVYYGSGLDVRANWEQELFWDILRE